MGFAERVTEGIGIRVHCAFDVPPFNGMVAGMAGDHPAKVYPVRDGLEGAVIVVPAACVTEVGDGFVVAPFPLKE